MANSDKRASEIKSLNVEAEKIEQRIKSMSAQERASHILKLKAGLQTLGVVVLDDDEKVFKSFIDGKCRLEDLTKHFQSRIENE